MRGPALKIKKGRLVFIGLVVFFVCYFVLPSTIGLVRLRWRVASALRHAKTVRLEEFERFGQKRILSSAALNAKGIDEALAALPYAPDLGFPGMHKARAFTPHHRIVAVAEDQTITNLEICFACGDLTLKNAMTGDAPVVAIPYVWRPLLLRFFTSQGIPVRDRYNDFTLD